MREQLLLLIRISKPEYNKSLYDEYKLYMNKQISFNGSGLTCLLYTSDAADEL